MIYRVYYWSDLFKDDGAIKPSQKTFYETELESALYIYNQWKSGFEKKKDVPSWVILCMMHELDGKIIEIKKKYEQGEPMIPIYEMEVN